METELFEIQAEHLRDYRQNRQLIPDSQDSIHVLFRRFDSGSAHAASEMKVNATAVDFARCFLRLANLPNFALDRLSRYEVMLCRQAGRIVYVLASLDRRKPQERRPNPYYQRAFGRI
jgi:hypothetical protein